MIVSNALSTALDSVSGDSGAGTLGISPATLDGVAGAGAPHVGISPASADTDRAHVKATVVRNLLIGVSPF